MSRIALRGVQYQYEDGTHAFSGIDLDIPGGSRVALVGPNGAGKTSLLLALCGVLTVQGEIILGDTRLTKSTCSKLRQEISFVFQNPDDMLFMPTVLEDVCFGLDTLGYNPEKILTIARQTLERVGLEGYEERASQHLSFGERRRVTLAILLARQSSFNLLDEPTRELDPYGRRMFIQLVKDIPGTMILATHDLELVLETCERMILMDRGKLIKVGPPHDLLSDQVLMEAHRLEVPHSLIRHPHAHDQFIKWDRD